VRAHAAFAAAHAAVTPMLMPPAVDCFSCYYAYAAMPPLMSLFHAALLRYAFDAIATLLIFFFFFFFFPPAAAASTEFRRH